MTSDTSPIPAPPPGWAIVPADDARLDCLPVRPMIYYLMGNIEWYPSSYTQMDRVSDSDRLCHAYALPASQPEQASSAEPYERMKAAAARVAAMPPPTTDPKGEAGKAKAPLALLPPEALRQAAWAHALGAEKYGVANWRENKVCATTYVSAMMRHIGQYLDGEDKDAESGLSHLTHVIASANILIDAKHCGTLVDDRPTKPPGLRD